MSPKIKGVRGTLGETVYVFGRLVVLVHPHGALRAIYVATDAGLGRGARGVISTLDPDAGTWYVDEPTCAWAGLMQCRNCSRFGHRECENKGVMVEGDHFLRRRKRAAYRISSRATAATPRMIDTKRRRRIEPPGARP